MATFSVNQVNHVYVANELKNPKVVDTDAVGAISVTSDIAKKHLYFNYMSPGGLVRTDLIDINKILYAKATDASAMKLPLKRQKLTLDPNVNGGLPISGQDYILNITFREFVGISQEDMYFKYGMVHAVAGMTASDFYKTLGLSLLKNFSRFGDNKLLKFYLETGGTDPKKVGTTVELNAKTKAADLKGTYTGIVVEEAEQPWILGVYQYKPVHFIVMPRTVTFSGDELIWGVAEQVDPASYISNGKTAADLEYFSLGDRGDKYRMVGFPNVIHTKYVADPTLEYNAINIHYCFVDSNEGVQKSEKDITILVPKVGATNAVSNKLANDIITAINTATGLKIDKLDATA